MRDTIASALSRSPLLDMRAWRLDNGYCEVKIVGLRLA